jgi:hypothetical protein
VEVDERSGHPRSHRAEENVEKLRNVVHSDRLLSINESDYVKILNRLREVVLRKRPELWPSDWIRYRHNSPAQKAPSVK